MTKCYLIYKITNLKNNKVYVGRFSGPIRKFNYYFGSGTLIKRAFAKYGENNFKKEIIDECQDHSKLLELEVSWIARLRTKIPCGYNLTDGGDGAFGFTQTQDQKNKISKSMTGRVVSEITRNRLSAIGKEQKHKDNCQCCICKAIRRELHKNGCKCITCKIKRGEIINRGGGMLGKQQSEHCKEINSRIHLGQTPWNKGKMGVAWNRGLNKETDTRVLKNSLATKGITKVGLVGRTYEQIHGKERAAELRALRSKQRKIGKLIIAE